MIEFQLDETSGVATYLQLVQQVHQALRMGMLEPGDQLPTAQQVVAQLAINPNTVHKAYRELERRDWCAPGRGLARSLPACGRDRPGHAGTVPRRAGRLAPFGTCGGPGSR